MERKSGFAFHCHHDTLVEYVWDYDYRVRYIKNNKPLDEQELRLKLFRLIPLDRLPPDLVKASTDYDKARAAHDKVLTDYEKALTDYEKAWAAYKKALQAHSEFFHGLHTGLCPDCPWDGKTIFPNKEK